MKVNRFKSSEVSVGRLLEAAIRRVVDLPHMMAWRNGAGVAGENRKALRNFRDKHLGERCIIMANGPSLAKIDPSMLRGETTFGLNRIYLMADVLNFLHAHRRPEPWSSPTLNRSATIPSLGATSVYSSSSGRLYGVSTRGSNQNTPSGLVTTTIANVSWNFGGIRLAIQPGAPKTSATPDYRG